jgi:peptidyl-prolyl cis-trans isomerase A (cyclophilin A)
VIALVLALSLAAPPAAEPPVPSSSPRVAIRTSLGELVVELDAGRAPVTVANFLRYVDAGRYAGGAFHRTVTTSPDNQPRNAVKIDVVQAGPAPGPEFAAIPLERTRDTGLRHVDGAVSMARDGPDTATADFFVCVGAQPELDHGGRRNPDGQGFAVFGRVVSGMDVVRRIHAAPAKGQALAPPVRILGASRVPP